MSLLRSPSRGAATSLVRPIKLNRTTRSRARTGQPLGPDRDQNRHTRTALAISVLIALTLMAVDATGRPDSAVEPLRIGAAEVFGPLEAGADAAVRPVTDLASLLVGSRDLQADNTRLTDENAGLRAELATGEVDRNRLAEYDALAGITDRTGFKLVNAQVVAIGPAQAFRRTVTINADTAEGVKTDRTVVNGAGLVGRVLRAGRHTATVLLVIDAGSVVGGRLDRSMELGFLRGNGSLGADGRLVLDLVDPDSVPVNGDTIVTWGSRGGSPYVPGVPVGTVREVQAKAGDQSVTATVEPFADMTSLDVVGVVTGTRQPRGTSGGAVGGAQ